MKIQPNQSSQFIDDLRGRKKSNSLDKHQKKNSIGISDEEINNMKAQLALKKSHDQGSSLIIQ